MGKDRDGVYRRDRGVEGFFDGLLSLKISERERFEDVVRLIGKCQ